MYPNKSLTRRKLSASVRNIHCTHATTSTSFEKVSFRFIQPRSSNLRCRRTSCKCLLPILTSHVRSVADSTLLAASLTLYVNLTGNAKKASRDAFCTLPHCSPHSSICESQYPCHHGKCNRRREKPTYVRTGTLHSRFADCPHQNHDGQQQLHLESDWQENDATPDTRLKKRQTSEVVQMEEYRAKRGTRGNARSARAYETGVCWSRVVL